MRRDTAARDVEVQPGIRRVRCIDIIALFNTAIASPRRTLVLRRPVPLREAVGGSPPRAASSKAELAADVLRAVSSRLLGAPLSPRDLLHLRPGEEPPPQAQRNTFVYLLRRSGDGRFYCGETDNLAQRLAQHARAGGAGAGQPCEAWAVAVTGGKSKARVRPPESDAMRFATIKRAAAVRNPTPGFASPLRRGWRRWRFRSCGGRGWRSWEATTR